MELPRIWGMASVSSAGSNWAEMRQDILEIFPAAPGIPSDVTAYLKQVEDIYVNDAYNSLSIEGYKVSVELIEKVRSGNCNPEGDKDDIDHLAKKQCAT